MRDQPLTHITPSSTNHTPIGPRTNDPTNRGQDSTKMASKTNTKCVLCIVYSLSNRHFDTYFRGVCYSGSILYSIDSKVSLSCAIVFKSVLFIMVISATPTGLQVAQRLCYVWSSLESGRCDWMLARP